MAQENGTISGEVSKGVKIEWRIKSNIFLLPDANLECISSPLFHGLNSRWKIDLFPNGYLATNHNYIALYLTAVSEINYPSVSVLFKMKIGKLVIEYKYFEERSKDRITRCGYSEFLKRSKFLRYLLFASQDVIVECHIHDLDRRMTESVATQTSGVDWRVADNFKELFLRKELCDINIQVEQKNYQAHKAILAARSPVFCSMFNHEMAENIDGRVEISDCDPDSFEAFLRYIYTGDNDYVTYSNAIYLYKTADKYLMDDLKKECCTRMSEELEILYFCDVLDLAETHDEAELLGNAIAFFIKNGTEILATEKWLKLMIEHPMLAHMCVSAMAESYSSKLEFLKSNEN